MRSPNYRSRPSTLLSFALVWLCVFAVDLSAQIPAFPGAEGYGAYANGGRGGDVYYVTNLNNNGAGSLREGLNTVPAAGRTIVFAVSGYIPVNSDTNFNVPPNVTIAGQTAPGDGVGLKGGRMLISGNDVVMRHFRIRHGRNGTGGDCLNIAGTASNTIIDHVSMMFSTDENFSFFSNAINNFTMQNSSSSWGMERHNAGGLWDLQNGSCIDSLWAHHRTRNPKARPSGLLEWINNVTFHWRGEPFIMGDSQTPANWKTNAIGNYYISIDDPDDNFGIKNTGFVKAWVASNGVPNFSLFLDNTLFDNNDNGVVDGADLGYGIVAGSEFQAGDAVGANRYYKAASAFSGASGQVAVTIDDPLTAYKKVVSSVGPLRFDANYTGPLRDELDTLLQDSVVNQYSVLVQKDGKVEGEDPSRPNNGEQHLADTYGITNYGFGTLNGSTPATDSDLDGMPDFWEIALNGKDGITYNVTADDHNIAFTTGQILNTFFPSGTATGYTLLEEYLHYKSVPHASMAKHTDASPSVQTVNLAKYTDAFTATPVYTISNLTNGTVQQFLADGVTLSATGPIVQFMPTDSFVGRAGFNFNVSDAEGSSWTQQFALLVTNNAAPRDLVWIGDGSSNLWDDSTSNWQDNSGATTTFGGGDTALFDDRGSASLDVTVSGAQYTGSLLVTGMQAYSFSGSGSIASTGALTKAGDSTLTLDVSASFASGTYLNGGETVLYSGGDIDGGAIHFTGGSTLTSGYGANDYLGIDPDITVASGATGNLNLSQRSELNGSLSGGGTFNIYSPSTLGTEGRVYFDGSSAGCTGFVNLSGGATAPGNGGRMSFRANGGAFNGFDNARVDLSGLDLFTTNNSNGNTYDIGQLSGDANSRLRSNYVGGQTTWEVGALGTDSIFSGEIMNGIAPTNLNKVGGGTFTLSGANTYTGTTNVSGGGLHLSGSLGASAVTLVSGSTLSGAGDLGGSITGQSGSTLRSRGTVFGQVTTLSGATITPGDSDGERAVLTAAGGLDATSTTFVFDLSSTTGGENDRIALEGGSGYLAGTNTFAINLGDGGLSSGAYTLIDCAPAISLSVQGGMSMDLQMNVPSTTRQSFALQRTASGTAGGYVRLNVSGSAADLTWSGSGGPLWDLNSSANFSGGNTFYNLDQAHFDDTASSGDVDLIGTLEAHRIVVWNHTLAYTFDGSAGSLSGAGSLEKTGSQTLSILASGSGNSYTGGTILYDGTLAVSGVSPLGYGLIDLRGGTLQLPNAATFLPNSMVFSGSSVIASLYSGNSTIVNTNTNTFSSAGSAMLDLSGVAGILSINGAMDGFSGMLDFGAGGGQLRLNSNSSSSQDRNFGSAGAYFALGNGSAGLTNRNGNIAIQLGALSGGGSTSLSGRQSGSGDTSTTYYIGALDADTTFAGTIYQGGDLGGLNIVKVGSGVWTLSGASNIDGSFVVQEGTLALSGSLACSEGLWIESDAALDLQGGTLTTDTLEISEGALFSGSGIIDGELVNQGAMTSISGTLTVTGSVENSGTLTIKSGAQLIANGPFVNYGILDLLTASSSMPSNLNNLGVVIDSSGLEVLDSAIVVDDFELTIMTYSGHVYQFQHSDSLAADSWEPVGTPIAGNGSSVTFVQTDGAVGAKRFFRVLVD